MKKTVFLFTVSVVFMMIPLNVFGAALAVVTQGKKYALVIGNNNYVRFPQLSGAGQDAAALAEGLKKIDFEVTLLTDATAAQMDGAIDAFAAQLRGSPDNQGFFWFSGIGVQLDHTMYLRGIDTDISVDRQRTGVVSLGKVFEAMSAAKNTMNVVIVDTQFNAPDNETPVSLEQGLLEILTANIGYIRSTSPGESSADNSPFIGPVMKYLSVPAAMALTFQAITRETVAASGNKQRPLYYTTQNTPNRMSR